MPDDPDELAELRREVQELRERVSRLEAESHQFVSATKVSAAAVSGRAGLTTINRIGAVTVAIGLIFFFKYAVDEHLIGAWAGVALGVLFGGVLIVAGDWLVRHSQPVFAQGITGCGLAAVYISLYAAFDFYALISQTAGFIALAAVCAGSVALAERFSSAAIATLGIAGALLTPWLLQPPSPANVVGFVYLLAVTVTAIALARRHQWAALVMVAGALSLLAALGLFRHAAWWFAEFAFIFSLTNATGVWRSVRGTRTRACLYVMAQVAFLLGLFRVMSHLLGDRNVSYQAASVLLACWGIAELTLGLARASRLDVRIGLTMLGMVIAKLYVWDVWSLDKLFRISAFLGLGALLLLASWIYSRSSVSDRL